EATPGRETRRAERDQTGPREERVPVVEPGVRERLAALDPGIRIHEGERPGSHGLLFGWRTPMWTTFALLVLWLGTFALVRAQPRPGRATRAAWSWLVLLGGPVGAVAYLVLGGPTGLLGPPPRWRPRLTGGWAFLL